MWSQTRSYSPGDPSATTDFATPPLLGLGRRESPGARWGWWTETHLYPNPTQTRNPVLREGLVEVCLQ